MTIHDCARGLGLVAVACTLLGAEAPAAGMSAQRLAKIHVRMQEFVDRGTAAGMVTMIERHGRIASLDAVGYQDLARKTPMRADTIFELMSMTKSFTCAGIMILMEEGKLSLIDPVEKFLPEFKGQKLEVCPEGAPCETVKPSRPIQIRDLMTHTSGMGGGKPSEIQDLNKLTLAEAVSIYARQPLAFEPGTKWRYSNMGIATAGRIVEVVSGMPYERFIEQRILKPLGMRDSFFFPPANKRSRIAAVYTGDHGTLKPAAVDIYRRGAKYPGPESGLYSTAADLAAYYQMLLDGGTLRGARILSRYSVQLMTQVETGDLSVPFAPGLGYGFGLGVVKDPAGMFRLSSIGSFGHGGAFRTYAWVDPAKDMVSIILLQRTNGGGDVADEINAFLAMAAAAIE